MATQGSRLSIFQDIPPAGERRRSIRHKIHSRAYASFDGVGGGMVLDLTEIENLSEGGMMIRAASSLISNRTLNLVLDLSETKTYIDTTGFVVWSDRSGRAGIRFSKMSDSTRQQLLQWLFFNLLAALAKAAPLEPAAQTQGETRANGSSSAEIIPPQAPSQDAEKAAPLLELVPAVVAQPAPQLAADAHTLNSIRQQVEALGSDLDAIFHLVAERAQTMCSASGAALALGDGEEMVCRGSVGDAPGLGARFQIGSGFSGECVRTGKLQLCQDSEQHPLVDRESCRQLGIRSMLAVPILSAQQAVVGLFEVFSPAAYAFGETDVVAVKRLIEILQSTLGKYYCPPVAIEAEPSSETESQRTPWLEARNRLLPMAAVAVLIISATVLLIGWFTHRSAQIPAQISTPIGESRRVKPSMGPMSIDDLRDLANQGDPVAQYALGARYYQGDGVIQDYSEAVRWFIRAAEQGHVPAQAALGAYYWAGRGVPQDLKKAYFWSVLARASGDEGSKYRVAALTARMSRQEVIEAEQEAEDWLHRHLGNTKP